MKNTNFFNKILAVLLTFCATVSTFAQCGSGQDIFPPVFNESLFSLDIYEDCADHVVIVEPTITDNCDPAPTMTVAANDTVLGPCPNSYVNSITYRADDFNGNFSLFNITVHVMDLDPPLFDQAANELNQTVSCESELNIVPPTATDNCGMKEITVFSDNVIASETCAFNYTRTITYRALDLCNNFAFFTASYTVNDETPPVFNQEAGALNQTASCGAELTEIVPPTASDNCGTVNVSVLADELMPGACSTNFERIITYIAEDPCGNASYYTVNILVQDDIAPVISSVPGSLNGNFDCSDMTEFIPPVPEANDNCGEASVNLINQESTTGDCVGTTITTYTYQAVDACGNTSQPFDVVISIGDETGPVWTSTTGALNNEFSCNETTGIEIPVPQATDNCSDLAVELISSNTIDGSCAGSYQQTYTYQATDACGNTSATNYTVTLSFTDSTPPSFNETDGALDITIACNEVTGFTPPVPTATDNCSEVSISLIADEILPGTISCSAYYERTLTYQASDACGNEGGTYDVRISVIDNVPPSISGNFDEIVYAGCGTTPDVPTVFVSDNCDSNVQFEYAADTTAGTCAGGYIITRTWTASDACGNDAIKTQVINVEDNLKPVVTSVPPSSTTYCAFIPEAGEIQVTDNCDTELDIQMNETTQEGNCPNNYLLRRVWTITDDCNNEAISVQEVSVIDTVGPVFQNFPGDVQLSCNLVPEIPNLTATDVCGGEITYGSSEVYNYENCPYTLTRTFTATDVCQNTTTRTQTITLIDEEQPTFANVPISVSVGCGEIPLQGQPQITDNCDTDIMVSFDEVIGEGCPYTIVRTWTATDDCGNSKSASQTITVEDNSPPQIQNVPESMTLTCSEIPDAPVLIALDNCSGEIETQFSETTEGEGCDYTIIRTWTATDLCDNPASATQTITVSDDTDPELLGLPVVQLSLSCDQEIPAPATVTAIDNCDPAVDVVYTTSSINLGCANSQTIFRNWFATDACGNFTNFTQSITVQDESAPEFNEMAGALDVIICSGELETVPQPGVQDNCTAFEDISLTFTDQINNTTCESEQLITRTYTATDICDNSSTYVQNIHVYGGINAMITGSESSCAVSISGYCTDYTLSWTDNFGNSGNGSTYTPDVDTEGTVVFSLYNSNAPDGCNAASFEAPFNCVNTCPQIISVNPTSTHVCSGMPFGLNAEIINADGGSLNWYYADGTAIADPTNVVLTNATCETITQTFYAEYISSDSNCGSITLNSAAINVYPEINFTVDTDGCEIHLLGICPGFSVTWTDGFNKEGNGAHFIPDPGSAGSVVFTIYNLEASQAPLQCQILNTTQDYDCGPCPSLSAVDVSSTEICSSTTIDLNVNVIDGDGGSVVWYDNNDNPIPNPTGIYLTTDNCAGETFGFYAVYTPLNSDCENIVTDIALVTVYPEINATIVNDGCTVALNNLSLCSNAFEINWVDSYGNTGSGPVYPAQSGTTGSITFTVTNTDTNTPAPCATALFIASFDCGGCPQITLDPNNPTDVCYGSPVTVTANVDIQDGNNIQFFHESGLPLSEITLEDINYNNCTGAILGYYASYQSTNAACPLVQTEVAYVNIYPEIVGTLTSNGCEVNLSDYCEDFNVSWEDNSGNTGTGSYTASNGMAGTVTYTIENPNGYETCTSATVTGSFDCSASCPEISNPTCSPPVVCEGQPFNLGVLISNLDGGTLQWFDQNGNPIINTSDIVLNNIECASESFGYYATYTPDNASCASVTSEMAYVTVHPEITATVSGAGCNISLDQNCPNFEVTWYDNFGNSGTGNTYVATSGTNGNVSFTVSNPAEGVPAACQSITSQPVPFNCENCPNIYSPTCNPPVVCEGQTFGLSVLVSNLDGGSIQWYDENDNAINSTDDLTINVDDCEGGQYGYYAVYTPANSDCATVSTEMAYVTVFPSITADVVNNACEISLENYCPSFQISWSDSDGNVGVGSDYTAMGPGNGNVTFTIFNSASNAPAECQTAIISEPYNCVACPEIFNPACSPAVICQGESFNLTVGLNNLDGGVLNWYDQEGNLIANANDIILDLDPCSGGQFGYYAEYVPTNATCPTVTTDLAYVTVYPEITGTVTGEGCNLSLTNYCQGYDIAWEDNNGNAGTGINYVGTPGTEGTVTYTISHPDPTAPAACQSLDISAPYACAACPEIFNVECSPSVICSGETFNLIVGLNNTDGGTLNWYDENDNIITSTNDILMNVDQCTGGQFGYYVSYTPANATCPTVTSEMAYVTIYPEIAAQIVSDGCNVSLANYCSDFQLTWEDGNGNAGTGDTYSAVNGESGTLTFTLTNPATNIPTGCSSASFEAPYACLDCPQIFNPTCNPPVICDGESFSLVVGFTNLDGGTLQWYDQDGNPVNNTMDIIPTVNACEGGTFGYYVEYTPNNSSCATVSTEITYVTVYPQIDANVVSNGCSVNLEDYCSDFVLSWIDDNGNTGIGNNYTGSNGSGTVSFTLSNPGAAGNCLSETFNGVYNCGEMTCPSLANPVSSSYHVCSASTISLGVDVIDPDGGSLQWFDSMGNEISDPNNMVLTNTSCENLLLGFYAVYTSVNSECPTINSNLIEVTVYPEINYSYETDGCTITLADYCENFWVSWISSTGKPGDGPYFDGDPGETGLVEYTIYNPSGGSAPIQCQLATVSIDFSCGDCPGLINPSASSNYICEGSPVALDVTITNGDGGTLQWFTNDNVPVADPANIVLETESCGDEIFGYYAVYTPATPGCAAITTESISIHVFPNIEAEIIVNECDVFLTTPFICDTYEIEYQVLNGSSGTGFSYTAADGSVGSITFTVTNLIPGAPTECLQATFSTEFDCGKELNCPLLDDVTVSQDQLCNGESFTLSTVVVEGDGGTLTWYDLDGNIVDPTSVTAANTNCTAVEIGYYPEYQPADTECPIYSGDIVYVTVHPSIAGTLTESECAVSVLDICDNFNVSWVNSLGQSGTGNTYQAATGTNGSVTFTVTNPTAPAACNNMNFVGNFNCADDPIFDLALTKVLSPGQNAVVSPGDPVSFTITVYNQGDITAQNIQIADYIPNGLTLADAAWAQSGGIATTTIPGPIAPNGNETVSINFTTTANTAGTITNFAEIASAEDDNGMDGDDVDSTPDSNAGNDGTANDNATTDPNDEDDHDPASVTVEIEEIFDLALMKVLSPGQNSVVSVGDQVNFTITVYNQGDITAQNIQIADYIPNGLTLADAAWAQSGGIATTTIAGPIAPNGNTSVTINFTVTASFTGVITNFAEIAYAEDDNGMEGDDIDSFPDSNAGNDGTPNDNATTDPNDEDDHDPAPITIEAIEIVCPEMETPSISSASICSGQSISLSVNIINDDGGSLAWFDQFGTLVSNPSSVVLTNNDCGATYSYYAVYTPGQGTCTTLSSTPVTVTVHPEITATISGNDCQVDLDDFCSNFNVTWTDNLGNNGTGDNYIASVGQSGTVTFTVSNPNAPAACQSGSFSQPFNCPEPVACPSIYAPVCNPPVVCSGQTFALNASISSPDNGTINWYDEMGNPIADPSNVSLTNTSCSGFAVGFYATYTPANSACAVVTTELTYATVYSQVSAALVETDCQVYVTDICPGYEVNWVNNFGNSGTGSTYNANEGQSGLVTFTVTNPNAPAGCNVGTYSGNFNCAAATPCPSLNNPTSSANAVCAGQSFSLNVNINNGDGGSLAWYTQSGMLVSNPANVAINESDCNGSANAYYAIYTPSNSSCASITSGLVNVISYPQITANAISNDCQVYLADYCTNYNVIWSDNLGNSGAGSTYNATQGQSGNVTFTVTNPAAPTNCQTASFSGNFNCAATTACPVLSTPQSTLNTVCEGQPFGLSINITDGDGGSLQWYDQTGSPVSNPSSVTASNNSCSTFAYGYYAIYTPANNNCANITSQTVYVNVYPQVDALVNASECQVYLYDFCTNYNVNWTDNIGNAGTGATYNADSNTGGTVTFTITNPDAPAGCNSATYSGSFNCQEEISCPMLDNPVCSPSIICEGQPFSLTVGLNNGDGGAIQWFDQSGNELTSFDNIMIDVDNCFGGQFGYYAVYTPSNPSCPVYTSPLAYIVVHPEISATFDLNTEDCVVDLDDYCSSYNVSWTDNLGNAGSGDVYNATNGTNGMVTFTVSNPNAPAGCSMESFTSSFNCSEQTECLVGLENAQAVPPVVCSGDLVSLSVSIVNGDGGSLAWYDTNGELINNPNSVLANTESCTGGTLGYYAIYTPANGACPSISSMTTLVQVYPEINAGISTGTDECSVQLTNYCENFGVSWTDSFGNSGSGNTYNATQGQSGQVSFTVSNQTFGVPTSCNNASFTGTFDCSSINCPEIVNPVAFPEIVCSGGSVNLGIDINAGDGGSLQWYNINGTAIANPNNVNLFTTNCAGETQGFYAVYTPANGACTSITSSTILVQVYPLINSGVNILDGGCTIELADFCPNYSATWFDDMGNTGTGNSYTAATNTSGNVTFTVSNLTPGVPSSCNSATITSPYACNEITPVSCDTIYYCTEPVTEVLICPDFCGLQGPLGITEIEAVTGCVHEITNETCISYTPFNSSGTEVVNITACNGTGCVTVTAVISIDDDCDNDTPNAVDDSASTEENINVTINVLGNDFDPDGDNIYICENTLPLNGNILLNNGIFTYTPNTGFSGTDIFTYTICDGNGGTSTATVFVYVDAGLVLLDAQEDSLSITNGEIIALDVLNNDQYPNGCSPMLTIINPPGNGFVSITNSGLINYEPQSGFTGEVSFAYEICCGESCDVTTVRLDVGDHDDCLGLGLPNGFSPNGDGVNETFTMKALDNCFEDHNVDFKVFNRFGEIVYIVEDYTNDRAWTGKDDNSGNYVPEGTYFYVLIISKDNSLIEKSGSIRVEY